MSMVGTAPVGAADAADLSRGNYFAESRYVSTDVATGVMRNRAGSRIVVLTVEFLVGFRRAILDECGQAADAVFKSCGRRWGQLFAKRFEREMTEFYARPLKEFPLAMFKACLAELFSHHGWGQVTLDVSHHHRGLLVVRLDNAVYADILNERADRPVDTLLAGILGGFFGYLSAEDLDALQTECPACGGATSRFVVGLGDRLAPVADWPARGKTHDDVMAELTRPKG